MREGATVKTAFLFQFDCAFEDFRGIYAEVQTIANGDNLITHISAAQRRPRARLISVTAYKTTKAADTAADVINNELLQAIRAQGLDPAEVLRNV